MKEMLEEEMFRFQNMKQIYNQYHQHIHSYIHISHAMSYSKIESPFNIKSKTYIFNFGI